MTNITFIKNFAGIIEEHFTSIGKEEFFKKIFKEDAAIFTLKDGTDMRCTKISEHVVDKKRKIVQTELIFFTMDEEDAEFLAVMRVTSNVNNTGKFVVKYKNFRDFKMRGVLDDDIFKFFMAFKFFAKFPGCNNLLSFAMNVRNENGDIVRENISTGTWLEEHPMSTVTEMGVYI